jgi:hypothetical protein
VRAPVVGVSGRCGSDKGFFSNRLSGNDICFLSISIKCIDSIVFDSEEFLVNGVESDISTSLSIIGQSCEVGAGMRLMGWETFRAVVAVAVAVVAAAVVMVVVVIVEYVGEGEGDGGEYGWGIDGCRGC